MADLFFYGTLRHLPLLERVLGRSGDALAVRPARLRDHAVRCAEGQPFPMIVPEPGQAAEGLLVQGLGASDLDRLAFYEGGFEFDLRDCEVQCDDGARVPAQVFFPAAARWTPGAPWLLDQWVARWGPMTLLAADEVMSWYGRIEPADIAKSFPAIRTRAWARLAARERRTGDPRDVRKDVIAHRHHRAYVNYFGVDEIDLQYRRHDGTMGPVLNRSALMQGGAVVVLPYDPVRDCVLLVEQFRPPVYLIDDPEPWVWEPVAGMIDPGETPEQTALRETMEEAGVSPYRLENAGEAYSSTGSSTEFVHLYVGLCDLTDPAVNGGLTAEGEDIRSRILPCDAFIGQVDRHGFKDMPLLVVAHWLARHRDRLRG
ncbi:nudix-type nucleoside diphosphatase, YffH/AdpP family [Ruegeria intermedia]|uniref:ADP-ribose pyrophosphatase n=1 Tax=Ruegeria intermedia TaxID=996115 RepID=A0A1M5BL78_9RHOB|nr:NUDIX domain-containing protein [Ruegeria intermedia]SHF43238.1 nudix-type nucleoside diphosphatase, YffH/AdpP family [Ruegeria intermedia]